MAGALQGMARFLRLRYIAMAYAIVIREALAHTTMAFGSMGHPPNNRAKDAESQLSSYDRKILAQGPPKSPSSSRVFVPQSSTPSGSYPTSSYPISSYPTSSYPTSSYPTSRYPTSSYPTSRYPTSSYPTSRYPGNGIQSASTYQVRYDGRVLQRI
eukprot:746617-Hanusia_phi.AAC.1